MKKLVTVVSAILALATFIFIPSTALAGKGEPAPVYDPVYGVHFLVENNTTKTLVVTIDSGKGGIYMEVPPVSTSYVPLECDTPPEGFTDDWFNHEGKVVVKVGKETYTTRVPIVANLSVVGVIVNPGKKKPQVEITLTQ